MNPFDAERLELLAEVDAAVELAVPTGAG